MENTRVVYWNNIPTPYVVGRFNAIARRRNLDFEAWFNERREADRSWDVIESDWGFSARYIPVTTIRGRALHLPLTELREAKPDAVVSLYGDPSFALGAALARHHANRLAFRVLPTFDTWVQRSIPKEVVKHGLFRIADGVKTPGPNGEALAMSYGMPKSRIANVPQSVDVEHFSRARTVSAETRERERHSRGLHGCVFLYVGRLWTGKGVDCLVNAFIKLREKRPNSSLLIVGDGVDEARLRAEASTVPGVWFEGFVQPSKLPDIYAIGDVFVFPTLGDPHGLVVEESFAAGLPVICTEAAGDIRGRIRDGETGFIVPPGDADSLAVAMERLVTDEKLRVRLGAAGYESVLSKSHDEYARGFEVFIDQLIRAPARRNPLAVAASAFGVSLGKLLPDRPVSPLVSSSNPDLLVTTSNIAGTREETASIV